LTTQYRMLCSRNIYY